MKLWRFASWAFRREISRAGCGWRALIPAGAGLAACVLAASGAAPDLIVWAPPTNPQIVARNFTNGSCEVVEGCALPGTRRYLILAMESRNAGDADLVIGDPLSNTNFMFATCHGHYHFDAFADYRLMNSAGLAAALGNKVGFCLEDVSRWSPTARTSARFDCSFQGIQAGWADVYHERLPCQWIDITDTAPGLYQLELEVNPERRLPESNYSNNVARLPVVIDAPCSGPPANDSFNSPVILSNRVASVFGTVSCATRAVGERNHAAKSGSNSIWFRWTAPYTGSAVMTTAGSTVDTLLAVYRGTNVAALSLVAANDDDGVLQTSRVSFTCRSNFTYQIAVAGYLTAPGGIALHINPAGNDNFTNALPVFGSGGRVSGLNATARREPGEPWHAGAFGSNSVWFRWRAPSSGFVQWDTDGSSFDTLLAVYTGDGLSNLVTVAANDDSATNRTSRVLWNAEAGREYWIAVDGRGGMNGLFNLNWETLGPAPSLSIHSTLGGGLVRLQIHGAVSQRYRIERSLEASNWSPWRESTNQFGVVEIEDVIDSGQRFYRVLVAP